MSLSNDEETDRTYAVQFVLEVDDSAFADFVLDAVPGPETPGVDAAGHKTYVDETGLGNPVVGASVPFADRGDAESLYESVRELDGIDECTESGSLAIREHGGPAAERFEPPIVARTACPN
ncbi:hypothetical protein [Halorussus halophilus]|uniref:hypothetical protein n=1 Tax=Halorussus halophilus TaxID=2650975 RepID=UPI001300D095|nr:hypothetical protein [Halorussus halophilus]